MSAERVLAAIVFMLLLLEEEGDDGKEEEVVVLPHRFHSWVFASWASWLYISVYVELLSKRLYIAVLCVYS